MLNFLERGDEAHIAERTKKGPSCLGIKCMSIKEMNLTKVLWLALT